MLRVVATDGLDEFFSLRVGSDFQSRGVSAQASALQCSPLSSTCQRSSISTLVSKLAAQLLVVMETNKILFFY